MGEANSSTQLTARAMLQTLGIPERDIKVQPMPPGQAAEALRDGRLDAFFLLSGVPATEIADLAADGEVALLPIDGANARKLSGAFPFFTEATIPANTYRNVPETASLSVGVLWLVAAEVDEKIVYGADARRCSIRTIAARWMPAIRSAASSSANAHSTASPCSSTPVRRSTISKPA